MIRTKPLDMNDLTRSDFSQVNADYDKIFGPSWPVVPCRRWEYVAAVVFSEVLNSNTDALICDAGSGSYSAFTHYLANKGFTVDAFDRNVNGSVSFANGGRVKYHNMSMIDIQFDDYSFDFVFSMSSIEHINAGKFAIKDMPYDEGDTRAMLELCRILKPGGTMVLTTDYGKHYIPPPGPYGTHRVYNWEALLTRLINPAVRTHGMQLFGGFESECDWQNIINVEPRGWSYTEFIFTLKK